MSFPTPGAPIGRRTVLVGAGSVAALFTLAACAPGGSSAPAASSSVDVSTELTSDSVELVIADETGFPVTDKLTEEFTKQFPNVTFTINRDTFANLTANSPKLLASDTPRTSSASPPSATPSRTACSRTSTRGSTPTAGTPGRPRSSPRSASTPTASAGRARSTSWAWATASPAST